MKHFITVCLLFCCAIATMLAQSIKLISLRGGERFNAGDTITLHWSGTTPKDTVRLEYSLDSGRTWLKIAARVSDSTYRWRVPDTVASHCLFRVAQVYGTTGTTLKRSYISAIQIKTLAFGIDRDKIYGGGYSNAGFLADIALAKTTATLQLPSQYVVNSADCSPDGSKLALASNDIRIWDITTQTLANTIQKGGGAVAFSHNGKYLAASTGSTILIYDVVTWQLLQTIPGFTHTPNNLRFDPTDRLIASCDKWVNTIKISDVTTGVMTDSIKTLEPVASIDYSPNGTMIASGEETGNRLWDVASGKLIHDFPTKISLARFQVRFSPDGSRLLTYGPDKATRLWDVGTGELIDTLAHWRINFDDLIFSRDGKRVVATDQYLMVFDLLPTVSSDSTWSIVRNLPVTTAVDTIDFKQVALNDVKDSLVQVVLRNASDHPVVITNMEIIGADSTRFNILDEILAYTLAPGETHEANLSFSPDEERIAHAQLHFVYDGIGSPAKVELVGEGVKSTLSVEADTGSRGTDSQMMFVTPNPIHDLATITFHLLERAESRLIVVDDAGKEVARVEKALYEPGWHSVRIDLTNRSSGAYHCSVEWGQNRYTTGFVLVH